MKDSKKQMLEGRTVHETVSKGEGEENENLLEEF
jgi:hypothetical protein